MANLSYGEAGKRNRLDVYRHRRSHPRVAPTLLYFHGGGYFSGTRAARAASCCTDSPVRDGCVLAPHTDCDPPRRVPRPPGRREEGNRLGS
jgi:acetyl esterase/lipase